MLELQTDRLKLIALDAENLRLSLLDPRQMERNLGVQPSDTVPDGELRQALEQMLAGVLKDEKDYPWYTHWLIVLRHENHRIGGFCFKGPPSENGEVEVGYGLEPEHQGKGYMSEALRGAVAWALAQPGVSTVLAETIKSNIASHRALKRAGFAIHRETHDCLWWKISSQRPP
jgi:ribosomal-protein-alanine N-acetyltransferase